MLIYLNKNANPKNRKTGDCSIRAIVGCTDIDYDTVMKDMFDIAIQTRYSMYSREVIEKVMNKYGWIKMKQPRRIDGSKFKVCEMDGVTSAYERSQGILCVVANHCVAIKDYTYIDIWNSGKKCVGNYYIKK